MRGCVCAKCIEQCIKSSILWLTATQYVYESSYNIDQAQTYFIRFVSSMSWSKDPMQPTLEYVESAKMTGIWPGIASARRLDHPAARLDAILMARI